ncbi:MAG: hypothetical protein KDE14_04855 [Rhodobacteraceae bacterium]|nr:hypothetical protein [Paracoccaceae bacterium]
MNAVTAMALPVPADDHGLCALIASLREHIAQLEHVLGATAAQPASAWLTPMQRKMFGMLVARGVVSQASFYTVLFGALPDCDQPEPAIIKVQMCLLRKRLRAWCKARDVAPIVISTRWGEGFFLDPDNKARARVLIKQEAACTGM